MRLAAPSLHYITAYTNICWVLNEINSLLMTLVGLAQELTEFIIFFKGSYGEGCNEICTCQNGGSCHHITGDCICPPGVKGRECEDGCTPGFYGSECDKVCPTACPTGFCDRAFGFCQCQPGYFGSSCEKQCPQNNWGPNCREKWVNTTLLVSVHLWKNKKLL